MSSFIRTLNLLLLSIAATSGLDDEQKHFYQLALDFAKNEMAPNMSKWDHEVSFLSQVILSLLPHSALSSLSRNSSLWRWCNTEPNLASERSTAAQTMVAPVCLAWMALSFLKLSLRDAPALLPTSVFISKLTAALQSALLFTDGKHSLQHVCMACGHLRQPWAEISVDSRLGFHGEIRVLLPHWAR